MDHISSKSYLESTYFVFWFVRVPKTNLRLSLFMLYRNVVSLSQVYGPNGELSNRKDPKSKYTFYLYYCWSSVTTIRLFTLCISRFHVTNWVNLIRVVYHVTQHSSLPVWLFSSCVVKIPILTNPMSVRTESCVVRGRNNKGKVSTSLTLCLSHILIGLSLSLDDSGLWKMRFEV